MVRLIKASRKACKTSLPDTVVLTSAEMKELIKLEKAYKIIDRIKSPFVQQCSIAILLGDEILFQETRNIGIHYFCLENNIGLLALSANRNISKETAISLFNKNFNDELRINALRLTLFSMPVVYNDLELFEMLFNKSFSSIGEDILGFAGHLSGFYPINVFMFLLPQAIESEVTYNYAHAIVNREKEILEWVNENNPALSNLPLAWVLKAYGYKSNLEELRVRYSTSIQEYQK